MRRRDFILASGAAVAWPLTAQAQQPAMPVIGWLLEVPQGPLVDSMAAAFRQGMAEFGYVEGKNYATEARIKPESLPQAAADLVRLNVNVIFAGAPAALAAARKATTSIPVIGIDLESDPVAKGYVKSLARPGGNITGIFLDIPELSGKQVGLLKEIVPRLSRIAIFGIPGLNGAQFAAAAAAVQAVAVEAEIIEVQVPMTGSVPWRPPKQGRSKPVSCCRPPCSALRSKLASLRWPNGSLSFPCSPNFQKPAV